MDLLHIEELETVAAPRPLTWDEVIRDLQMDYPFVTLYVNGQLYP